MAWHHAVSSAMKDSMFRFLAMCIVALVAAGCSQDQLLQKFSTPADQAEAKAFIGKLRARDYTAIEKAMGPSLKSDTLRPALVAMADLFPAGDPKSVKLVGAHVNYDAGGTTVNSTFEYDFGSKWFLINVAMLRKENTRTIAGLNMVSEPAPLESQNRFALAGKSLLHYAVLAAAIFSALLVLASLVACIRTTMPGRKWPWIVFILFGFGRFAINWSSGEWNFAPLYFQLFGASASEAIYGPWIISVSLPVGAIAFLFRKRKLRMAAALAGHAA